NRGRTGHRRRAEGRRLRLLLHARAHHAARRAARFDQRAHLGRLFRARGPLEMVEVLDTIIQGTLLGGLYALFAIGLSITYGVMRVVNIAHGDFLVLAAYLALWPVANLDMHPFVAILPIV